jgi:hypothetical protein
MMKMRLFCNSTAKSLPTTKYQSISAGWFAVCWRYGEFLD